MAALRVAEGKDFISGSENAHWLLTKWVFDVVRLGENLHSPMHGMYASPDFGRMGQSGGGDFAQGFGIVPAEHLPAVLWFYNHVICPGQEKDYDSLVWPHRAVHAFVNWPLGVKERNPADVLGRVLHDEWADYWVIRGGWTGTDDDFVLTMRGGDVRLVAKSETSKSKGKSQPWASLGFAAPPCEKVIDRKTYGEDGTEVTGMEFDRLGVRTKGSLAIDFSGLSGAKVLLVSVTDDKTAATAEAGEGVSEKDKAELAALLGMTEDKGRKPEIELAHKGVARIKAGGWEFSVVGLSPGWATKAALTGEKPEQQRIVIGKRAIRYDGRMILLEKVGE